MNSKVVQCSKLGKTERKRGGGVAMQSPVHTDDEENRQHETAISLNMTQAIRKRAGQFQAAGRAWKVARPGRNRETGERRGRAKQECERGLTLSLWLGHDACWLAGYRMDGHWMGTGRWQPAVVLSTRVRRPSSDDAESRSVIRFGRRRERGRPFCLVRAGDWEGWFARPRPPSNAAMQSSALESVASSWKGGGGGEGGTFGRANASLWLGRDWRGLGRLGVACTSCSAVCSVRSGARVGCTVPGGQCDPAKCRP